jgi:hypothetical protein
MRLCAFVLLSPLWLVMVTGLLAVFALMWVAALVSELRPRRFRERRVSRVVRSLRAEDALAEAKRSLDALSCFQVARSGEQPPQLPEGVPPDVHELLTLYKQIRRTDADEVIVCRESVGWREYAGHHVLRLTSDERDGPLIVTNETNGGELFENDAHLAKHRSGTGWPTLSHYLVYQARVHQALPASRGSAVAKDGD